MYGIFEIHLYLIIYYYIQSLRCVNFFFLKTFSSVDMKNYAKNIQESNSIKINFLKILGSEKIC